jgi:organic radical activating enzyme
MFGTNTLTGKSFFKDAPKNSLFVTSIFYTLQGEGPYSGLPALFVRLTKCNLTCNFCDTFFDQGNWYTYTELENKIYETIVEYWNTKGVPVPLWALPKNDKNFYYPNITLVVTGGEPLLQNNLTEFLEQQVDKFKNVQVESNGIPDTIVPEKVTLVCSPKCAEKEGKPTKYLKPSNTILTRADCLKFVMSADLESPYSVVPEWAHAWKEKTGKEIYVSPMNIYNSLPQKIKLLRKDKQGEISIQERSTVDETISFWEPGLLNLEKNKANHEYAARYCIDNGFRFQMQTHLFASLA